MGCKRRTALHQERGQEKIWKTIENLFLLFLLICFYVVIVNILQNFTAVFRFDLELTINSSRDYECGIGIRNIRFPLDVEIRYCVK